MLRDPIPPEAFVAQSRQRYCWGRMERALIARRLLPCKHEHGLGLIYLCLVGTDLYLLDRYPSVDVLHARLGLQYRRYESSKQAAREVNLMRTNQRITS